MPQRSNTKYGLFVVRCMNVGDDIQSLAALRFLPKVDYYIERDRLDKVKDLKFKKNEQLKVIMNGWYLGGHEHWPPQNPALQPLLTSIHINPYQAQGEALRSFTSKNSVKFLKKFSPVGARDMSTLKVLQDQGVDSYFSACLTLTLNRAKHVKKRDYILAVNVSDDVYRSLKSKTEREVIRMDVERTQDTTIKENLAIAKYYLYMYQSAHCVVTTRLHATLPTIAIGGKVLFIVEKNNDNTDFGDRFNGLYNLANHMTSKEFIEDNNSNIYDINNPPKNPDKYLVFRKELEKKCIEYTGHDSGRSYMGELTLEELTMSADFLSGITKIAEESWDSYKFKHRWDVPQILQGEIAEKSQLLNDAEALRIKIERETKPGIRTASKRLLKAFMYKIGVIKR